MPYILSPIINENMPGLWLEGSPYQKESIYSIAGKGPPVNYDKHIFKPHSLPHMESAAHTIEGGRKISDYYKKEDYSPFSGKCLLLKLQKPKWKKLEQNKLYHYEVSLEDLRKNIQRVNTSATDIQRIIISTDSFPGDNGTEHSPDNILTLSTQAAEFLVSQIGFTMYGTSWKSSDFQPNSKNRPIHNILFKKAAVFECLKVHHIPEGYYFWSAFPIPVADASESVVCPVLYTLQELQALCW